MADFIYVNPDYAELLERANLLDLNRLLMRSSGQCVGEHGQRITWREELSIDDKKLIVYIRQERKIPLGEIAEDILNLRIPISRAMKTLYATQLLKRNNIEVAPLLYASEKRFAGLPRKAVAIQMHVSGKTLYQQLAVFGRPFDGRPNPPARIRLFYELGAFIRKLHQGKIDWPDLVAKHIIVNYGEYKSQNRPWWKFTLIDIDRLTAGANAKRRNRQLDRFLFSFRGFITPRDLIRMARGYLGLNVYHPRQVRRNLWRKFFPDGMRWLQRSKEQMRILKNFPDDVPLQEEDLYERVNGSVVNMRFKGFLSEENLLERDALFNFNSGARLIKRGIGRRVRMRFEIVHNNQRRWFYLKRVYLPKIRDQIDRILCGTIRHSICWHERYMIKQLTLERIPCPVIVAYSEKMFLCFERSSALITEGIVGQSLEKFVPKVFYRMPQRRELTQRRSWIRQLAELVSRFHKLGFCHRDLYLSHIFISFKNDGQPIFYLIDLARCFKPDFRKRRWIIKDLSALNYSSPKNIISNTDRMRFFKTYLGKNKIGTSDKRLIRQIIGKTNRIAKHNRKTPAITSERKV